MRIRFLVLLALSTMGVGGMTCLLQPRPLQMLVLAASEPSKAEQPIAPATAVASATGKTPAGEATGNSGNGSSGKSAPASPYRFATVPDKGRELVLAEVNSPDTSQFLQSMGRLGANGAATVQIGPSLELFSVDRAGGLDTARTTNMYYYPVENAGNFVAMALLPYDAKSGVYGKVSLTTGNMDPTPVLAQLAKVDAVRTGSFEARILRVPAVSSAVFYSILWLKATDDNASLFYAYAPAGGPPGMQIRTLCTTAQFKDILAALAKAPVLTRGPRSL